MLHTLDLVLALLATAILVVLLYFFMGSFYWGAGYQPTPAAVVRRILEMARIQGRDRVYDLGAGTGSLLFPALDAGAGKVVGVELEPIRFLWLRVRRRFHGSAERLELERGNLFRTDLRSADVVLVFLWPAAMRTLSMKLRKELHPGARVVSYWHPLEDWTPRETDPKLRVYAYEVPSAAGTSSPGASSAVPSAPSS